MEVVERLKSKHVVDTSYNTMFVGTKAPLYQETHTFECASDCRGRIDEKEFDFTATFYMLPWSRYLATNWSIIWNARDVIPVDVIPKDWDCIQKK